MINIYNKFLFVLYLSRFRQVLTIEKCTHKQAWRKFSLSCTIPSSLGWNLNYREVYTNNNKKVFCLMVRASA